LRSNLPSENLAGRMQKLHDMTKKRLDDVNHPKAVKVSKPKGVSLSSSPEDILKMMEQLKDKVDTEPDPEESSRIIARIQALNASYVQLMGTDAAAGPGGGGNVKSGLEDDLTKYSADLKAASAKEGELREQLDELREKLEESQPHVDRLRKERDTCSDVVRTLRDKITAINDEYQAKFDEFKSAMDAWAAEREEVLRERCASPSSSSACSSSISFAYQTKRRCAINL
jgi:chromosome segregation ATPase